MKLRAAVVTGFLLSVSEGMAAPVVERVTPDTIPTHIDVEVTAIDCDRPDQSNVPPPPWYASVSASLVDVAEEDVSIGVLLRDPDTDAFIFNPGTRAILEGDRVIGSIAFAPGILDQIVFQWRESSTNTIYEIYLSDFYSGDRC